MAADHAGARVLLADDHKMVAEGLARLLADAFDLVATVYDGLQLVDATRQLRPDVIVTDVTMPLMTGLEAMRTLKRERIGGRFVFLTIHQEPHLAAEVIRDGASGFLLKQAAGEELITAVRAALDGGTYLSPLIARDVLWALSGADTAPRQALTPRQREVLRLLADGRRMKEIAAELGVSVRTVENHKYELMRAIGAKTNAELVKFAIRQGLARG
jgi:two-component system, NarL family, response regulator NreC